MELGYHPRWLPKENSSIHPLFLTIFTKPQVVKNKFSWITSCEFYQSLFLFGEGLTFLYWRGNINFQHLGNWYLFPDNWDNFIEHNFNPPKVGNHTSVGNSISFPFPKCLESSIKWRYIIQFWLNYWNVTLVERAHCVTDEKYFGNNCHSFYS